MSDADALRPLTRPERALIYGLLGWAMEVAFTGLDRARDPRTRDRRLEGHSYLWMLPIYASIAYLYEPVHNATRRQPWWRRGVQYAAGIVGVEYASGIALKRTVGVIPWDYTGHSRTSIHGATRLDYLPLWGLVGLGLERIHDELVAARVRRSR